MRSIFKLCLSSSLLSALDIFKTPIYLLFDKQPKTSTKTGIFCTIVITVLLTIMTSRSDIFQKKSPKLLISDLPVPTREKVEFSRKILAVGLQDEETGLGYIDETIYSIGVTYAYQNEQTDFNLIENQISLHTCEPTDFDDPNIFNELNLENNYCLDKNATIDLLGYWDEKSMSFLKIELNICDNSTSGNICKPIDEIKEVFRTKNSYNIYFENTIVDLNDYLAPIRHTVQNEYKSADLSFKKIIEMSMKNVYVDTDDGLLFDSNYLIKEIKYDEQKFDFYAKNDIETDKTLFRYEIFASKNVLKIDRSYEKVSDLLARLGGILKALMVFGFIFTKIEFSLIVKRRILNLLFEFPEKVLLVEGKEKETEKEKKRNSNEFDPPQFPFSITEYIWFYIKRIFYLNLTKKERYFMKGEYKFLKRIELPEILKKLQQIKLLKNIVLTNEQKKIFRHLKKPLIKLRTLSRAEKSLDTKNTLKMFETMKLENKLSAFDEKLLSNLRPELSLQPLFRKVDLKIVPRNRNKDKDESSN